MCGIFFSLSRDAPGGPDEKTIEFLQSRGPDAFEIISFPLANSLVLTFCSSVLALRGDSIQKQPLVDSETGSILCWNGEAWDIGRQRVQGNDGLLVFELLRLAAGESSSSAAISEVLTCIEGPFAFVFYDALSSSVYYGRDRLGRRSLIVEESDSNTLTLSSIATSANTALFECSTDAIHHISLHDINWKPQRLAWRSTPPVINESLLDIPDAKTSKTPSSLIIATLLDRLSDALTPRVLNIPVHNLVHQNLNHAKIAILFSGGLDCTLLARICHDLMPHAESIDLLNVTFENPRSMTAKSKAGQSPYENCPDRVTGRASFNELVRTCPQRQWRFVAIDIPYAEVVSHKPNIIRLMRPHNTEMDLSIAMALYFAARGQGHIFLPSLPNSHDRHPEPQPYSTTARVLLSGLGADELFAGYTRHAAAFSRGSYEALIAELDLDFTRIGKRNLGRDDRVMSHWSKEVRYPYLDEQFVEFALGLPVWEKCGFREGKEVKKHFDDARDGTIKSEEELDPAKMLLRMGAWRLGMKGVAGEKKRAIQFGARTAKMEVGAGRKRGTDVLLPE